MSWNQLKLLLIFVYTLPSCRVSDPDSQVKNNPLSDYAQGTPEELIRQPRPELDIDELIQGSYDKLKISAERKTIPINAGKIAAAAEEQSVGSGDTEIFWQIHLPGKKLSDVKNLLEIDAESESDFSLYMESGLLKCVYNDGAKQAEWEGCQEGKQYKQIYLEGLIPNDRQTLTFQPAKNEYAEPYLLVPPRLVKKLVEARGLYSYDLTVVLPSSYKDDEALFEFMSTLFSRKEFEDVIAAQGTSLPMTALFPDYARRRVAILDYYGKDFCHSAALAFVDKAFADKSKDYKLFYDEVGDFQSDWAKEIIYAYQDDSATSAPLYFDDVTDEKQVRFGDILIYGNHHSVVYLANGYVYMKDNQYSQHSYRIVTLKDIATSGVYPHRAPTHIYRRNNQAIDFSMFSMFPLR